MINRTVFFNKYYKQFNIASIVFVICSILLLAFKGLNYGIDFKGGTLMEINISEDQIKVFMRQYPQVSKRTIAQWISNHDEVGGRRQPLISYTLGELQTIKSTFEKMQKYRDYVVLEPRNLRGAMETGIAQAFRLMKKDSKTKSYKSKKGFLRN